MARALQNWRPIRLPDRLISEARSFFASRPSSPERGAVLLEVVLALVLFVGAATVITAGLRASVDATDRLRHNTHAANLAVSILSELKMGVRPVESGEPQPFEPPFETWTWQILTEGASIGGDSQAVRQFEVVVRHLESGVVLRLAEAIRLPPPPASGHEVIGAAVAMPKPNMRLASTEVP